METDPKPGIPKKLSNNSEPVNKYGIESDTYVTMGINAFLKTCFTIITDPGKPFDRAVST